MKTLRSRFWALLYFVFLGLGIHAAYHDRIAVALFFAITCAGESIAVSIDYWPILQDKKVKTILQGEERNG